MVVKSRISASKEKINEALKAFSGWARPWTFINEVISKAGLTAEEVGMVEAVWKEANEVKYWVEPSFRTGPELVREGLQKSYPWLDSGAIEGLIRGASYQWK